MKKNVFKTLLVRGSYQKFDSQRKSLLRYIVCKALEDRGEPGKLHSTLKEFLVEQDMSVVLLMILTLGLPTFKYTLANEGDMTREQSWLF